MNSRSPRPAERGQRSLIGVVTGLLVLLGCEPEPAPDAPPAKGPPATGTAATAPATASADAAPAPEGRRGYEIPIPQLEFWAGTQVPKFRYEMRFDPPEKPGGRPRLHRNGWAYAYYGTGVMERQGAYRYDAALGQSERVGIWTYYTQTGEVDRTEDRGGEVIWTGPGQAIAPPGTDP